MDHAGIATQFVVERKLAAEKIRRQDLGREEFERRVWKWKAESGGVIKEQMIRLGASCDWTRERFTLEPALYRAVLEAFLRLYREGLIYRGRYMVNWCPRCQTAISDLEVVHTERAGQVWNIRYPDCRRWRQRISRRRHHAPGNDAWRYGRRRPSGRRALPALHRQDA